MSRYYGSRKRYIPSSSTMNRKYRAYDRKRKALDITYKKAWRSYQRLFDEVINDIYDYERY